MNNKNLANCKPSEFLKQTYKIKKSVEKWLTDTDILNIRKKLPDPVVSDDLTKEEAESERNRRIREQMKSNFMAILDAILDTHADETLEVLALLCFVEPENVDDHEIGFYLDNFSEIINNQSVIGFFTSLAQLGLMNTPNVSQE